MDNEKLKATEFHLDSEEQFAERGIVSKTLHQSASLKVVLFSFEKGQALSEHTAPFEAVIHILKGKGEVMLGGETREAVPGALYVMPAGLVHAIKANERLVFLLTMAR